MKSCRGSALQINKTRLPRCRSVQIAGTSDVSSLPESLYHARCQLLFLRERHRIPVTRLSRNGWVALHLPTVVYAKTPLSAVTALQSTPARAETLSSTLNSPGIPFRAFPFGQILSIAPALRFNAARTNSLPRQAAILLNHLDSTSLPRVRSADSEGIAVAYADATPHASGADSVRQVAD